MDVMHPDDLLAIVGDLVDHEGCEERLYLDDRGHPTIGIGELVSSEVTVLEFPLWNQSEDRPATAAEKVAEFQRVSLIGQPVSGPSPPWRFFSTSPPRIMLPTTACYARCRSRLANEFIPALQLCFKGFDGYPFDAKRVLCDVAWNVGVLGITKFRKLAIACAAADWVTAAEECDTNRPDRTVPRKPRNRWRHELMLGCSQPLVA